MPFKIALDALHIDGNSIGVNFGVAHQRVLDFLFKIRRRGAGLDRNQVAYSFDSCEPAHDPFSVLLLILPLDLTLESDPAFGDGYLNFVRWHEHVPLQGPERGGRDIPPLGIPFSLLVVPFSAMQNSSHLIASPAQNCEMR